MEQTLDKKDVKRLEEALHRAKEEAKRMREKEEAKRWAPLKVPLGLLDVLSGLTKDDLVQIARNLEIKKVSQLKKQDLIEELITKIPQELKRVFLTFDLERYHLVKKTVEGKGYTFEFELSDGQLQYLYFRGILFSGTVDGKKALVIPREIQQIFEQMDSNEYISIVEKNTEWIKLTQGLLYYCGTLSINQLEELLEKYLMEKIELHSYAALLYEAAAYYSTIRMDTSGFSHYQVFDSEKLMEEHQSRPKLKYFPFSKEQLMRASEAGFVDRHKEYREFVTYILDHYNITEHEAEQIVEECVNSTNHGEPLSSILDYLQSILEIERPEVLQEFIGKLIRLMNNTRQWALKGYTPAELAIMEQKSVRSMPVNQTNGMDFSSEKKVGRNDPCPCGSGKKYKKCCIS